VIERNWRELITPSAVTKKIDSVNKYCSTFVLEPLERGFGTTLGNALRRILLSSLQGAAVTNIRIDGIVHEFGSIPGVREDVTDIVLNVKGLAFKSSSSETQVATLDIKGPCTVTAAMIQCPSQLEVMNPDAVICVLDEGATFKMDMHVDMGKGYLTAAHNKKDEATIGVMPIDALFSPIKRVTFAVEDTRVGQETDYDKLSLIIETNGSVTAEDALAYAARILQDQISVFINFQEPNLAIEDDSSELDFDKNLLKRVNELDLSVRSANCLEADGVVYIGDLIKRTEQEMLSTPNFGRKSLNEIKAVLSKMGLSFGMEDINWPPENLEELARKYEDNF
jgi:DNA-directed RNA polymerase subunit alpha